MLLNKRGIDVSFIAHDGSEAIERYKIAEKKPSVILMDHHMRGMNGIDTTKKILDIDRHTKIIFLSADMHVREEALKAGASAFLNKPVSINKIIETIKEV